MPSFGQKLILVSQLFRDGFVVNFHTTVIIGKDRNSICQGTIYNNLYYLHPN